MEDEVIRGVLRIDVVSAHEQLTNIEGGCHTLHDIYLGKGEPGVRGTDVKTV